MAVATLREVLDEWQAAGADRLAMARIDHLALAQAALALGHPTLASEILREPARAPGASAQARYLAALAGAKIGALRDAKQLVDRLLADASAVDYHGEALALAGRIAKDRWARLPPGAARDVAGSEAIACYQRAWDATRDPFPGINAATMLQLTGHPDTARKLAREVQFAANAANATMLPHWREATLGEASLLLGESTRAVGHYTAAVTEAGQQVGHIASMRRQLRLLGASIVVPDEVKAALSVPRVVVFTGHMTDAPGRASARFPAALENAVSDRIETNLEHVGAGFGYCSAACGADLLFIEAMLARRAEVHITLPFDRADFIATSVAFAGEQWVARFDHALQHAASVTYGVRERFLGDESLFAYAGALMQGAAVLRAGELEAEPLMLAVLDEAADRRAGGARDVLANWQSLGLRAECIEISALRAQCPVDDNVAQSTTPSILPDVSLRSTPLRRDVRTMLFADMVGYSRLSEEDTPSFLVHFLGAIADIVAESPTPPSFVNTWGDGLFMVFDDVAAGAGFALQLRDAVSQCDWPARGLPQGTSIRIGMHTGPVFHAQDRLIGRENYFGSHVIRAARIEPVVAPGAIFVSAELAFILSATGSRQFATDYLGTVPLAKGYASGPLYRLRSSAEAE
ncbi:MAG: TRAFs-binding domain-containing protein [Tahibacter sp.]